MSDFSEIDFIPLWDEEMLDTSGHFYFDVDSIRGAVRDGGEHDTKPIEYGLLQSAHEITLDGGRQVMEVVDNQNGPRGQQALNSDVLVATCALERLPLAR